MIPLHLRSHRIRGPAVVTIEKLSRETTERQVTKYEPLPTSVPIGIVSSGSLQGQEKITDPKDILPGSLVEMMPSAGVPEQSPTTGFVRAPVVRVLPTPISSLSSSEKLDYSGDDIEWDNACPVPDTSKFSYLTEEEVQVAVSEKELPIEGTATTDGILSASLFLSCQLCRHCLNICFDDVCRGCRYY